MKVLKIILIVMLFVSLAIGFFLVLFSGAIVSKNKNTSAVAHRKELRNKMIGYVFLMLSFVFGIFQSLITL